MNFHESQLEPRRNLVGFSLVVLFHVLLVWALVSGLAKKVVDVVRAPIDTKVIEEVKQPPLPPMVVLPPPKLQAPPPPFIPPPEVQIATPPPPAPTIAIAPSPAPPAPVDVEPQAPIAPAPPAPSAAKPSIVSIGLVCPNQPQPKMPTKAVRDGISGSVKAIATIKGGNVVQVDIVSAKPRGVFESAVRSAMMQYECKTAGDEEIHATQDFDFKLD